MTTTRGSENLLDKPTAELEQLLLQVARTDVAPAAARERAVHSVASAALGLSALSGTVVLASRSSLFKGTSWLVAKWLAFGAGFGLVGLGVVQGVQELAAKASAPSAVSSPNRTMPTAQLTPHPLPLATSLSAAQVASAEPAPEPESTAALSPAPASAAPLTRDAKATPPLPSSTESRRSALTRELSLLEQVRGELSRHSAGSALQTLEIYRSEFPRGAMQVEAATLRIEAVEQSGDHAQAQRLAQAFLSNFPASPLAARVQAVAEVSEAGEQKP
jgi:hypothetical protein